MLYALLCILFTGAIMIIFRELRRFNLPLLHVITVNYVVCVALGLALHPHLLVEIENFPLEIAPFAVWQGALFIAIFFVIGIASQNIGVGYTAMLTRFSVVFPVVVTVVGFGEHIGPIAWVGICCALVAIVLMHLKFLQKSTATPDRSLSYVLLLSAALFFGTGATDTNFALFSKLFSHLKADEAFGVLLFAVAGVIGALLTLYQVVVRRQPFPRRVWVAGLVLGVPNYLCIFFLQKALTVLKAALFFPLNNISVLLLINLVGVWWYKEHFTKASWAGLGVAAAAIALISWDELAPVLQTLLHP